MQYAGGDILDLLGYADLARKGMWPVAGGALEQTEFAQAAFRYIWGLEDRLLGQRDHG